MYTLLVPTRICQTYASKTLGTKVILTKGDKRSKVFNLTLMNKLIRIEWVSEWVSEWVIECLQKPMALLRHPWAKNDHAYEIAYLKCTLNLNSNSKNEAFSLNISQKAWRPKDEGQSWYLSAFLEIFIIRGLKSDAILSVVDRNVAIFTTRHVIMSFK